MASNLRTLTGSGSSSVKRSEPERGSSPPSDSLSNKQIKLDPSSRSIKSEALSKTDLNDDSHESSSATGRSKRFLPETSPSAGSNETNQQVDDEDDDEIQVSVDSSLQASAEDMQKGVEAGKVQVYAMPKYQGKNIHEFNAEAVDDKPWRRAGADITDWFNYGFNEDTWRQYCEKQLAIRNRYGSATSMMDDFSGPQRVPTIGGVSMAHDIRSNIPQMMGRFGGPMQQMAMQRGPMQMGGQFGMNQFPPRPGGMMPPMMQNLLMRQRMMNMRFRPSNQMTGQLSQPQQQQQSQQAPAQQQQQTAGATPQVQQQAAQQQQQQQQQVQQQQGQMAGHKRQLTSLTK